MKIQIFKYALIIVATVSLLSSCSKMVYTNEFGHKEVFYFPAKVNYDRYNKLLSTQYKIEPFDIVHCFVTNTTRHTELLNRVDVRMLAQKYDSIVYFFIEPFRCNDGMDIAMVASLIKEKKFKVIIVAMSYDLDYIYRKLAVANIDNETLYVLPVGVEFCAQAKVRFIKEICSKCFEEKKEDLLNVEALTVFKDEKNFLFDYEFSYQTLMKLTQ